MLFGVEWKCDITRVGPRSLPSKDEQKEGKKKKTPRVPGCAAGFVIGASICCSGVLDLLLGLLLHAFRSSWRAEEVTYWVDSKYDLVHTLFQQQGYA